jgi:hypothetical protein
MIEITQQKPFCYIETRWEKRDGYPFDQPYKYCNDIRITSDLINSFKNQFGSPFDVALHESRCFEEALTASQYNSDLWTNENIKNKAFNKIYTYFINGKSGTGSTVNPLFPFEIFLLNDRFEMISFCELTALVPGISLVCDSYNNSIITEPKRINYTRCYIKNDLFVYLGFGIIINERTTKFYFKTNKSDLTFQVDNDVENYQKAINGKLNPLETIKN